MITLTREQLAKILFILGYAIGNADKASDKELRQVFIEFSYEMRELMQEAENEKK